MGQRFSACYVFTCGEASKSIRAKFLFLKSSSSYCSNRKFGKVKRCLIPFAIFFSFTYNIPKYFELKYNSETGRLDGTTLRLNPIYINYYILW